MELLKTTKLLPKIRKSQPNKRLGLSKPIKQTQNLFLIKLAVGYQFYILIYEILLLLVLFLKTYFEKIEMDSRLSTPILSIT